MLDLLRALDEELPNGSEVTLFNMRVNDAVIGELRRQRFFLHAKAFIKQISPLKISCITFRLYHSFVAAVKSEGELRHIEVVGARGDPLKMQQLRHRLDVTAYKCAIILCDQSWLDPDLDLSNGIAISSQVGMLRLDSLVLAVQLNIRKLLEVSC